MDLHIENASDPMVWSMKKHPHQPQQHHNHHLQQQHHPSYNKANMVDMHHRSQASSSNYPCISNPAPLPTYSGFEELFTQVELNVPNSRSTNGETMHVGTNMSKSIGSHLDADLFQEELCPLQIQPMALTTASSTQQLSQNQMLENQYVVLPEEPVDFKFRAEEKNDLKLKSNEKNEVKSKEEKSKTSSKTKTPKSKVKNLTDEKVTCEICNKTLANANNLIEHRRIHTGERPYTCHECGASFTARCNLRTHKRLHTGERPYMCGICGKTFSHSSHLPAHMRVHTKEKPYKCTECPKSFSSKTTLRNHVRLHTGDCPWVCDHCGKKFACKGWLEDHFKVHTGEKPFQCETCGKWFKDKSYIDKHKLLFCGNDGYKKRWKEKHCKRKVIKKPKDDIDANDGVHKKRTRGRPKGSKNKKSNRKTLFGNKKKTNKQSPSSDENIINDDTPEPQNEMQFPKYEEEEAKSICNVYYDQNDITNVPDSCGKLDTRKSLRPLSPSPRIDNVYSLYHELDTDFTQLQPENLSQHDFNSSNGKYSPNLLQPENLSQPQKMTHILNEPHITSHLLHQNPLVDPNDMCQPQNLTIDHSLSMEPQNLSLADSMTQPQNLSSHHNKMTHDPNHLNEQLTQPLSLVQSHNVPQNLSLSQDLSQPQNLSLSHPYVAITNLPHLENKKDVYYYYQQ